MITHCSYDNIKLLGTQRMEFNSDWLAIVCNLKLSGGNNGLFALTSLLYSQ